jgi:hypothetical protein
VTFISSSFASFALDAVVEMNNPRGESCDKRYSTSPIFTKGRIIFYPRPGLSVNSVQAFIRLIDHWDFFPLFLLHIV